MIRASTLLLLLILAGCEAAIGPAMVATGASVVLTGRTLPDMVISAISGRDCSLAYLDGGEAYCRSDQPPAPVPFCTRSLGSVECWRAQPPLAMPPSRQVADSPPAQPPARPWWEPQGRGQLPQSWAPARAAPARP
ncbi:hypothetical protein C8P66_102117 [Humitalea rosea]|uniref:Lipoprotein n=1 Tax=Humitalea rosea TaxID=990373 RepID=A0A2W7IT52_9PROT|nr:hypothetical protein [Humitalea rosea]PZW50429.1 hypothetical protein C8P66_102117 [Humitalea rosea]